MLWKKDKIIVWWSFVMFFYFGLGNEERIPLLFVDVNIGKDKQERITIYRGDNAEDLSREFAGYHSN